MNFKQTPSDVFTLNWSVCESRRGGTVASSGAHLKPFVLNTDARAATTTLQRSRYTTNVPVISLNEM